jgi:predicted XRE-type DNA-binding protein
MSRIERYARSSGLTQKECSARMGVTQPRLNDLLKAKIDKFSLAHRHDHNIKTDQRNKITD